MEEQKYYTPAPEDIRVGFECEVQVDFDAWEHAKVYAESKVFELAMVLIETNGIRVPYLTAEQIEAEGWTRESTVGNDICLTKSTVDGAANLMCFKHHRVIICRNGAPIYNGTIRCINDLRSISNLIGI